MTPVFAGAIAPLFFVASRAPPRRHRRHHPRLHAAGEPHDRGGRRPHRGLPAGRRRPCCARPRSPLCSAAPRTRCATSRQNLADLRAQVAANARGGAELRRMVDEFGPTSCSAYMRHVQDNADEAVRRAIDRLGDGSFRQEMDDGSRRSPCASPSTAAPATATVDFTGTSAQRADNFNAPAAVCTAAVLYVFRTLVDADIPLNAGCLRPLRIVIPPGSMLDPRPPGRGGRGQRRDLAGDHQRAVRRARRLRGLAGHDEQPHLRRRPLPVLRDDLRRRRSRPRLGTAAAPSTRT